MEQNYVQIIRRAILVACRKYIEHLLNEHRQNIGLYRNTLELLDDLLDLIAKGNAQFVYVYLENSLRHSVALVCDINQCFVTICILHYISLHFLLCLCPYSQVYCIVLLCHFCVPCHSAPCRDLPWNLNWLPPIKISSHKLQALWAMSLLLNTINFF